MGDLFSIEAAPAWMVGVSIILGMLANTRIQSVEVIADDAQLDHLELVFELVETDKLSGEFMRELLERKRKLGKTRGVLGKVVQAFLT